MNKEMVLESIKLKKKFCKDCNIPITVFDNPYFYQRLCTLEPVYNGIDKFDIFCEELECYRNEQEYFEHYNVVKEKIIDALSNNTAFQRFLQDSFDAATGYPERNIYIEDNDTQVFISIDMKKANFSALHHYDPEIFNRCETWEEYVGSFTDDRHIIGSKYIRQVVMGACNPKKQIRYEKWLMSNLLKYIVKCHPSVNVFSLGSDEIILHCDPGCGLSFNDLLETIRNEPSRIGSLVRINTFNLFKINGTNGWLKMNYDDTISFKCLDGDTIHQVVKYYFGEPITKDDLVFYHNGKLATYLEAIDNPWKD